MEEVKVMNGRSSLRLMCFCFSLTLVSGSQVAAENDRWLKIDEDNFTITYDLTTVQMIGPGKFTIISTNVDHPDVMRLRLAALDTLRSYCMRPDGKYKPPIELFTLGKPDLPVEEIEVKSQWDALSGKKFKTATWDLAYRRLARDLATAPKEDFAFIRCEGWGASLDESYLEARSWLTNGSQTKVLYDCKRSVMGFFRSKDDSLSNVITTTNIRGAYFDGYLRLCRKLTGHMPYIPPE
jgi:hypothetical protein